MTEGRVNALLLAALLFAQLLLIAGAIRDQEGATVLEEGLARATRPVVGAAESVGGAVGGGISSLRDLRNAREENRRLVAELERLRAERDRLREEAAGGATAPAAPRDAGGPRAPVDPRARRDEPPRGSVAKPRHRRGNRRRSPPRLSRARMGGAVGRVVSATPTHAKVRLLTDPNSGVAGIVQRSRAEGMILGRGGDVLEMAYVPKYADVLVGDRIVTSGLDGVFPKGVGIGIVTAVEDGPGASKAIEVTPEVRGDAIEEVLVLLAAEGTALLESGAGEEGR
jgi:Cell shape-determining protein